EWAPERIASSRFKHRSGHENPASWKVAPWSRNADSVSVGAFRLPARLLKELPATELLSVSESLLSSLPLSLRNHIRLTSPSELYLGNNPIQPEVGDERIVFRVLYPTEVSIVARQARGSFEPFNARSRSAVELIELGELDAASMIDRANQKNRIIAWVLRGCGFFCCFIGIALGFAPLAMVADIIPLLGDVIRAGTTIAALALSAMVSLATIAIAWFAYRPWLSGSLLAIGLLLFFMIRKPSRRRARS
ncbi:MAG: TMEM43 family protein, partial [Verrucomicrobiota bacterium]